MKEVPQDPCFAGPPGRYLAEGGPALHQQNPLRPANGVAGAGKIQPRKIFGRRDCGAKPCANWIAGIPDVPQIAFIRKRPVRYLRTRNADDERKEFGRWSQTVAGIESASFCR